MTLQDLQTLVDYHFWAHDRLLDAVAPLTPEQFTQPIESSFPSVRETLVHMCEADGLWISRWNGHSPTSMPQGPHLTDVAALRADWRTHERNLRALIERLGEDGIRQPIAYQRFDGGPQAQPFALMLQHLVNHGSYHRGQVTTMLRQLGAAPPKGLDLIAFYRERAAGA